MIEGDIKTCREVARSNSLSQRSSWIVTSTIVVGSYVAEEDMGEALPMGRRIVASYEQGRRIA